MGIHGRADMFFSSSQAVECPFLSDVSKMAIFHFEEILLSFFSLLIGPFVWSPRRTCLRRDSHGLPLCVLLRAASSVFRTYIWDLSRASFCIRCEEGVSVYFFTLLFGRSTHFLMRLPWSLCPQSMGLVFGDLVVESLLLMVQVPPRLQPCHPNVCGFAGSLASGGSSPTLPVFSKVTFPFPGPWHFRMDFRTHQLGF